MSITLIFEPFPIFVRQIFFFFTFIWRYRIENRLDNTAGRGNAFFFSLSYDDDDDDQDDEDD